jgi:protein-tyrosine phosphatase
MYSSDKKKFGMVKILFVCLGNICRSPLAEALFNHKAKHLKLSQFFYVDSYGTGNYHIGSQPDPRTIRSATKHGVEIFHACRQLVTSDTTNFDYIMAMDRSNLQNILLLSSAPAEQENVFMMRDFDLENPGADVPDPYHGGEREFQEVFDILDKSLDNFIEHLKSRHSLE